MNNIKIKLYHPSLDLLSDRTIRSLLKKLSSLCRELQAQEVRYLINASTLSDRERQSIRDRINPALNHIPAYYVDNIRRGSLEISLSVTAFAIWLLQITVGKSIEEAWKKSEFHNWLVEYLSSDKRKQVITRNVDAVIDNWALDRFTIGDIEKIIDDEGDIYINISVETPDFIEDEIREKMENVDTGFVIENSRRMLLSLENQELE